MKTSRIILHIDMNAFFASCEIAVNESLRGKPIVIAYNDNYDRGLITSPSYEARKLGIKTTMHVKDAKKISSDIIVVRPNYELYTKYSKLFYEYLLTITPNVEMASIDEAYVDVTDLNLKEKTLSLAEKIQNDLLKLYKLPCSIGIGPNKLLAKLGSDFKKPLGITVLRKRDVKEKIWPLQIGDMMGVGKKTVPKLNEIGIYTIKDFMEYQNQKLLIEKFGISFVEGLQNKCLGNDNSEVSTISSIQTSVSCAHTFMDEVIDITLLTKTIKVLVNSIVYRLTKDHQVALNLGVLIKYNDFTYFNKSYPLAKGTDNEYELFKFSELVFLDNYIQGKGIRQISIYSNRLKVVKPLEVKQLSIFDDLDKIEKENEIKKILEKINHDLGSNIIRKGIR